MHQARRPVPLADATFYANLASMQSAYQHVRGIFCQVSLIIGLGTKSWVTNPRIEHQGSQLVASRPWPVDMLGVASMNWSKNFVVIFPPKKLLAHNSGDDNCNLAILPSMAETHGKEKRRKKVPKPSG